MFIALEPFDLIMKGYFRVLSIFFNDQPWPVFLEKLTRHVTGTTDAAEITDFRFSAERR